MKRLALICFLVCALGIADNQSRPVIHLASSPEQVTYYSSPFTEASKFDFQYLAWEAFQFNVDEKDMQNLIMQVVMLKTDIEAKVPRSWYDLWNGNLKPYLLEKIMTVTRSTN